jgi:hypothetical protein
MSEACDLAITLLGIITAGLPTAGEKWKPGLVNMAESAKSCHSSKNTIQAESGEISGKIIIREQELRPQFLVTDGR